MGWRLVAAVAAAAVVEPAAGNRQRSSRPERPELCELVGYIAAAETVAVVDTAGCSFAGVPGLAIVPDILTGRQEADLGFAEFHQFDTGWLLQAGCLHWESPRWDRHRRWAVRNHCQFVD